MRHAPSADVRVVAHEVPIGEPVIRRVIGWAVLSLPPALAFLDGQDEGIGRWEALA
jgi:hypothetical protein